MSLNYQEIQKREAIVKELLGEGKSISQMAAVVGVTQQSMHKFLKVRGWQTDEAKKRNPKMDDKELAAKKAARRKLKVKVDRD